MNLLLALIVAAVIAVIVLTVLRLRRRREAEIASYGDTSTSDPFDLTTDAVRDPARDQLPR